MLRARTIATAATALLGLAVPIGASASTPPTPPPVDPAMDPNGLVEQAVTGYTGFVASFGDVGTDEVRLSACPVLTPDELAALAAPAGDAAPLTAFVVADLELEEYPSPDDPDEPVRVPIVSCDTEDAEDVGDIPSGDVAGVGIGVFDFAPSPGGLQQLVEFTSGTETSTELPPSPETFGGTVYGACHPDEESETPGLLGCYQFWIAGTFAIGGYVIIDESGAADVLPAFGDTLVAQLPTLLDHLAAGLTPVEVVAD